MSRIVEVPIYYRTTGTPAGKRKSIDTWVAESLPVEIASDRTSQEDVDLSGIRAHVSGDRLWIEAATVAGERIVSTPQAVDASRKRMGQWHVQRHCVDLTGIRIPHGDSPETRLVVPAGADWRTLFRTIDSTGREAVVEQAHAYAKRLSFVDGVLCTDRLEPLQRPGYHDEWFLQDVLDGTRLVRGISGSDPGALGDWPSSFETPCIHPVREPWAHGIRWEVDPSVAILLHLAKETDGGASFRSELDFDTLVVVHWLAALKDATRNGEIVRLPEGKLEEVVDALQAGVEKRRGPGDYDTAGYILNRIRSIRRIVDAMTPAGPVVPTLDDEDATALAGMSLRA